MHELKEIYDAAGGDMEKPLSRFGKNEEMLKHFILLFAKDSSFNELQAALADCDTKNAFRAAHTLKGICANLGFEGLYEKASKITELLRHGEADKAKILFPEMAQTYINVIEKITRLS